MGNWCRDDRGDGYFEGYFGYPVLQHIWNMKNSMMYLTHYFSFQGYRCCKSPYGLKCLAWAEGETCLHLVVSQQSAEGAQKTAGISGELEIWDAWLGKLCCCWENTQSDLYNNLQRTHGPEEISVFQCPKLPECASATGTHSGLLVKWILDYHTVLLSGSLRLATDRL